MRISDWSSDVCSSDLAAVTVLLTVELRWPLALSLYCYLAVLAVSGWVQLWLRRPDRERSWMHWAFPLIDMTVLVAGIVLPNPFDPYPLPPPMQLGFDTILYVVLFLVLSGLGQSRSEEHTSELKSLMRTSYAVFCLKKKNKITV